MRPEWCVMASMCCRLPCEGRCAADSCPSWPGMCPADRWRAIWASYWAGPPEPPGLWWGIMSSKGVDIRGPSGSGCCSVLFVLSHL